MTRPFYLIDFKDPLRAMFFFDTFLSEIRFPSCLYEPTYKWCLKCIIAHTLRMSCTLTYTELMSVIGKKRSSGGSGKRGLNPQKVRVTTAMTILITEIIYDLAVYCTLWNFSWVNRRASGDGRVRELLQG